MEEMNPSSAITLLPYSKEQQTSYISKVVEEFNSMTDYQQAELFSRMKFAVDTFTAILKHDDVRGAIVSRLENGRTETESAIITRSEAKSYVYDHCPAYASLKEQIKSLEAIMKSLKTEMVDPETGETIMPAVVGSISERITVKLKS